MNRFRTSHRIALLLAVCLGVVVIALLAGMSWEGIGGLGLIASLPLVLGEVAVDPPAVEPDPNPPPAHHTVNVDPEALSKALAPHLAKLAQEAAQEVRQNQPTPPSMPELCPENYAQAFAAVHRATFTGNRAGSDMDVKGREGVYYQMSRIINAQVHTNIDTKKLDDSYRKLLAAGHYDRQLAMRFTENGIPRFNFGLRSSPEDFVNAAMTTLTWEEAGLFVPDIILTDVAVQEDVFGLVRLLGRRVPLMWGVTKFPKLSKKIRFDHVGQGAEAKSDRFLFDHVEMTPRKAMVYIPWTKETNDVAGAILMPLVNEIIAESREKLLDDDAILGDGSSTYGGITGILNHADVLSFTVDTGKPAYEDIVWTDYNSARFQANFHHGSRVGSVYFTHPLFEEQFENLKIPQFSGDTTGAPIIFQQPSVSFQTVNGRRVGNFRAVPIHFSESFPYDNAASKAAFGFGNWDNLMFGELEGIMIEVMTAGNIPDRDTSKPAINLNSTDTIALKIKVFVEVKIMFGNTFVVTLTAAS